MSRSSLAFEIVIVLLIVVMVVGYIGVSSIGPAQPSASPTPTPAPSSQEQARDLAIVYIATNYPETEPLTANLSWTGGRVNSELLGAEKYLYNSNNWTVLITYPVIPNPTYTIYANYSQADKSVTWQGTYENSTITETSCITNGLEPVLSTQEQIREDVMAYIQANHTETAAYLPVANWIGGRVTPEGLVGAETYLYESKSGMYLYSWTLEIKYPVVFNPIYTVSANYTANGITNIVSWQGTWQTGVIIETNYSYTP